jgi:hypothetical protein
MPSDREFTAIRHSLERVLELLVSSDEPRGAPKHRLLVIDAHHRGVERRPTAAQRARAAVEDVLAGEVRVHRRL